MFKMVFLQFFYDLSDRDIEEQGTGNLLFKSFIGLSAEELAPDHTVRGRFRQRLGAEGFQRLFNQVVEKARGQGLVSDRRHIIDATRMTAKVDLFCPKRSTGTAMPTIIMWTAALPTKTPASAADPAEVVLRLQKSRGAGRGLEAHCAGPDHPGQRARRRRPANPGPAPGAGANRGQGLR
jgi:hypothetical protein